MTFLTLLLAVDAACADTADTTLLSADQPDDWSFDEDWMTEDDEHCYILFVLGAPDADYYDAQVDAACDVNRAVDFTQKMSTAGLDIKTALTEQSYATRTIAAIKDGAVYLSGFGENLTMRAGGASVTVSSETDDAVHPSKTWGVSYFSGNTFKKVDLLKGTFTEFALPEITCLKHVFVTENCIVIDGEIDGGTACVRIYDHDLNLKGQVDKSAADDGWFARRISARSSASPRRDPAPPLPVRMTMSI